MIFIESTCVSYKNDQRDDYFLTSLSEENVMEDAKTNADLAAKEEKDACTVRREIEDYLEVRRMRDEQGEFDDLDLIEAY